MTIKTWSELARLSAIVIAVNLLAVGFFGWCSWSTPATLRHDSQLHVLPAPPEARFESSERTARQTVEPETPPLSPPRLTEQALPATTGSRVSTLDRVKAWALVDPAFDLCVRQLNGPWALIPDDATAQQIEVFKYLVKAAIETSDRERERFRGHELEHQAELRQLDLDRQREFASSFKFVWPNARQPE